MKNNLNVDANSIKKEFIKDKNQIIKEKVAIYENI